MVAARQPFWKLKAWLVIWVGEVSFVPYDAKYGGHKVVREWTAAGLLATKFEE